MRYTMTLLEEAYLRLTKHLFSDSTKEQAAYILCRVSQDSRETRFIVRDVLPVPGESLLKQTWDRLSIPSISFIPILKQAADTDQCFFLVHSHPNDYPYFSPFDDQEEQHLFKTAYTRIESGVHGSLVFNSPNSLSGRIWLEDGEKLITQPISKIRILGRRYRFITTNNAPPEEPGIPELFFDRQVRAFGKEIQKLLGSMHIGVVGCGGTGSATIEQLARLGVGRLTVVDHDEIDDTNISRIHESTVKDFENGLKKTEIMKSRIEQIGFGTKVNAIPKKLIYMSVAQQLKNCDLIFGCTDDHAGRSVLNLLSIHYCIPVIDMGVLIDSHEGDIHNILGRVTIIKPNGPCMICRNRINADKIHAEMMDPEEYQKRQKEGYVPELGIKDPAVITFTTAVSSQAIMEMLNILTGFMGEDPISELVCQFDSRRISLRNDPDQSGCICVNPRKIGRGDYREFLDMNWPSEPEEEGSEKQWLHGSRISGSAS